MVSQTAMLHLQWIKKHPTFVCNWCVLGINENYFDVMTSIYGSWGKVDYVNCRIDNTIWDDNHDKCAVRFFNDDLLCFNAYENSLALLTAKIITTPKVLSFFLTIGFNHQTYTIPKCVALIEKILTYDWILKCRAVFEFHRENGEHPHCHFLITTSLPNKSKFLEQMWAVGGIKQVVLAQGNGKKCPTFIDAKPAEPRHIPYIMLDKADKKKQYIQKDIIWRKNNNIPEFFEKV